MVNSKLLASAVLSLAVVACKIEISVPRGGHVASLTQYYECHEFHTCTIDVIDIFFDETFGAAPQRGFVFSHWKKRGNSLCGNSGQLCELSTRGFDEHPLLMTFLESDEKFYLEPVFYPIQYLTDHAGEVQAKISRENVSSGYAHPSTEIRLLIFNRQESRDLDLISGTATDADGNEIFERRAITRDPISPGYAGGYFLELRDESFKLPITITLVYQSGANRPEETLVFTYNG